MCNDCKIKPRLCYTKVKNKLEEAQTIINKLLKENEQLRTQIILSPEIVNLFGEQDFKDATHAYHNWQEEKTCFKCHPELRKKNWNKKTVGK